MAFKCARCGECCSRYWITLLPEEAKEAAAELHIPAKLFIKKHTVLFLQLFPAAQGSSGIILPAALLPKKLASKIRELSGALPPAFLALPMLALKRVSEKCILRSKKSGACKIHPSKPFQCSMFPFIAIGQERNLKAQYPFCEGLGKPAPPGKEELFSREHYGKFKSYIRAVNARGIAALWPALPARGIAMLRNEGCGKISRKEMLSLLQLSR